MMSVKIFGKQGCSFCEKSKVLCDMYELEYEYIDATYDEGALDFLIENGFKSVPQIYVDGEHVGGYTDLYERLTNG